MKNEDILIPIGTPLGLWQDRGRIQNGSRLLELDAASYVLWFYTHLTMDVGSWVSLSTEKGVAPDGQACLSHLRELEEMGLVARLEAGEAERFLAAVQNLAAVRQGVYYRESMEELTFAIGRDDLRIPNVPLVKLVWMGADGHASLPELIRRNDREGICGDSKSLEQILIILLKNRLVLLEAKKDGAG